MISLNDNQMETWKQAYQFAKQGIAENGKKMGIVFGNLPNTKSGKEFFRPFLKVGYVHAPTLKYAGVFILTDKGIAAFEELQRGVKTNKRKVVGKSRRAGRIATSVGGMR